MKTRRFLTTLWVFILALNLTWAQGPNNSKTYYQAANGKSGSALKTALFGIIKISNAGWSYDGLKTAYMTTDTRTDGYLRDWYSNATNYVPGSDFSGGTSAEGMGYNREHLVPQSWFKEASPMKSDIWHVVPSDAKINNERGSDPLGEVGSSYSKSKNGYSKWGKARSGLGYSGQVFEPNDEVKGDIARAYFYMVTCYQDKISSWTSSGNSVYVFDGNTYPGLTNWCLTMMIRWSALDPVDEIEVARNNVIAAKQNRNPFIDYPGLEKYIWGDWQDVAFSYDQYVNPYGGENPPVTVSTPTFSPAGGTYTSAQNVTISCSTSGATIYYTTNGSTPTASSTVYSSAISISETTTLKAIAIKDGTSSNVATATYTISSDGDPTPSGETLLWESFSGYTGSTDGSAAITTSDENLDYAGWTSFTKLFLGQNGCGKLGSSSASGSMEAKNISLIGNGVLTFKVMKYSSDSGTLGVTITGATADGPTTITPQSSWTEYTINLADANGAVGIKFATSSKRAYIDDIKLVAANTEPEILLGDVNNDGELTLADLKALVKILLGGDTSGYNLEAADVNDDGGEPNIADVTKLVNLLLKK